MRVTQGTFSNLPDLSEDEIRSQVQYAIDNRWAVSLEFTDDPHPRNVYWEMWGLPMFDVADAAGVLYELNQCVEAYPDHYVRVCAFDPRRGRQTVALAFIAHRPADEPGFRLERQEVDDRRIRYTLQPYAAMQPHGSRYHDGQGP